MRRAQVAGCLAARNGAKAEPRAAGGLEDSVQKKGTSKKLVFVDFSEVLILGGY